VPSARQTSFLGGELSRFLWGRSDLPLFGRGARTLKNFFVTQQGAAATRPGTTYVNQVKGIAHYFNGIEPDRPVRLVPFIAGDDASYVLEFGDGYLRFHTLGGTVLVGAAPYEIGTNYTADTLWTLRFAQVGDVLTIASANYNPRELRRFGHTDWTLEDVDFSRVETRYQDVGNPTVLTSPFGIVAKSFGGIAPAITLTEEAEDDDHAAREWQWLVTSIIKDPKTGASFETLGDLVQEWWSGETASVPDDYDDSVQGITDDKWVLFPDKKIVLKRALTATPLTAPDSDVVAYNLYRGRGLVFGWVGQTTSREFVDVGEDPDYSRQPPRGTNPFQVDLAAGRVIMRPFSVGLFQERRFWGGAGSVAGAVAYVQQPGTIFGSAVGDYYDFDLRTEKHVDQEAIAFEIASRQHERIEHLMDLEQLLAFTRSSVWTIDGGVDSPLAWNRVMIRRIDRVGCGDVAPLEVDGCPLFIRKKGFGARALVPLGQGAGYRGADISQHAEHLFTGPAKNVVDWTYQEDPWGLVWAVRADGKLLSLQFSHEHSAAAWTPHEMKYFDESGTLFDEAFVEAICCVPEGDEDAVYMVVRRSFDGPHGLAVRNIERMTSRVRRVTAEDDDPEYVSAPTAADTDTLYPTDVCLDCAVPYAGPPTFLIPNLDPVVGEYVYVVARGLPLIGPIALETDELDLEPYLDDLPATNAVDEHGVPIFVCHVGLAFTADLETLDITADRLGRKTIERLGFEVDNSIGVQAGQDFDHLDDFQVRTVEDGYEPVAPGTQLIETPVRSAWDNSARAVLRQSKPVPMTVVGITRGLDLGG
jgi:hypothetical protein